MISRGALFSDMVTLQTILLRTRLPESTMVNVPYSPCHLGSLGMRSTDAVELTDLLIHHTQERQNKWQVVLHRQNEMDEHKYSQCPFEVYECFQGLCIGISGAQP